MLSFIVFDVIADETSFNMKLDSRSGLMAKHFDSLVMFRGRNL